MEEREKVEERIGGVERDVKKREKVEERTGGVEREGGGEIE